MFIFKLSHWEWPGTGGTALFSLLKYVQKVYQKMNLELDMNGIHQALAYTDDVKWKDKDIRAIERIKDVLLNDCEELVWQKK